MAQLRTCEAAQNAHWNTETAGCVNMVLTVLVKTRIMKVQGPSSSLAAGAPRRAGHVAPGFVLPMDEAESAQAPNRAQATASLTNLGALLALQGLDEALERRRRATKRSNDLIDQLDRLRLSVLGQGVSRDQVAHLANTLSQQRELTDDPALNAVLDEIEVRAQVELAKLERAL
ncbi:MAG: hypothetical protein HC777_02630 [Hyphomonadaceae bacterium]|nr:hypothetical protein [Hyphomonadaceae bacterium]